jgi:hypothetical protein
MTEPSEIKESFQKVRSLADAKWGTRFVKDGTRETRNAFGLVKHRFQTLFILNRLIREAKPQPETFEEAVERLGLTEEVIRQREVEFHRLALICGIFTLLPIVWLFIVGHSLSTFLGCAAVTIFAGVQWLSWSLRLWQVRNRTLCELKDFLAVPGWWKEWLITPER